jgi:TatA/E family protein of Tat protein translocase
MPELILIFVVALLLFGPRKMPQIGKSIGRALGEFRRASNEFKRTIEDEVASEEIREVERDLKEIKSVGRDLIDGTDLGGAFEDVGAEDAGAEATGAEDPGAEDPDAEGERAEDAGSDGQDEK